MMEALSSFETLVSTIATRRNIREDAILHRYRRWNLKSYTILLLLTFIIIKHGFLFKESAYIAYTFDMPSSLSSKYLGPG
jgi:hypothetical protein